MLSGQNRPKVAPPSSSFQARDAHMLSGQTGEKLHRLPLFFQARDGLLVRWWTFRYFFFFRVQFLLEARFSWKHDLCLKRGSVFLLDMYKQMLRFCLQKKNHARTLLFFHTRVFTAWECSHIRFFSPIKEHHRTPELLGLEFQGYAFSSGRTLVQDGNGRNETNPQGERRCVVGSTPLEKWGPYHLRRRGWLRENQNFNPHGLYFLGASHHH